MNRKKVEAVVARMRMFFVGSGLRFASRKMVEKWAQELEEALKGEEE